MEYSTDILSLLQSLELQRAAELKKFGLIALFVLFVNILFFIKFRSNFLPSLLFGFIVLTGSYYVLNTKYKIQVQNTLIPKLIQKIDTDFSYHKDRDIDINLINRLKFFSHTIENKESDGTVSVDVGKRKASFSFVTLESAKTDTEEGRHYTKRFEGLFVELDLASSYDQIYLISPNSNKTPQFEAGDYINPPHMGLELVGALSDDMRLYSKDGKNLLKNDVVKRVLKFKENLKKDIWVIFEKDRAYILVEGISNRFEISLFSSLKTQNFVGQYIKLLKTIKELLL